MVYDGFRSWRDWGTWNVEGMSWEQVWYKYETQILEELLNNEESLGASTSPIENRYLQEEITAQICLRILERSCITNEAVDKLLLRGKQGETSMGGAVQAGEKTRNVKKRKRRRNAERDIARIAAQLERDMEELLSGSSSSFQYYASDFSAVSKTGLQIIPDSNNATDVPMSVNTRDEASADSVSGWTTQISSMSNWPSSISHDVASLNLASPRGGDMAQLLSPASTPKSKLLRYGNPTLLYSFPPILTLPLPSVPTLPLAQFMAPREKIWQRSD